MDYRLDENYTVTEDKVLGTKIKHPAFGTIAFARRSGGEKESLFGSSIYHHDTIAMTVRHADMNRDLNSDWYFGDDAIVEVEMSYSQFVEAITNMNVGTGIPCTVRYTEKDGMIPRPRFIDKQSEYRHEMKEFLDGQNQEASKLLSEIKELFEKKSNIGKADRKDILDKISHIVNGTKSTTEFTFEQFQKSMDKTIQEAKGEIEAFTQNKMLLIAQQALVENRDAVMQSIQERNPAAYIADTQESEES